MNISNLKKSAIYTKLFLILSTFFGITLSLITAKIDGYTHVFRRILYFTALSNIWTGFTATMILLLKNNYKIRQKLYIMRFYSVVAITMTSLVFCFLLAPFSDSTYKPWTFCNLLTHVVSPFLALVDFIMDNNTFSITDKDVKRSLIPPIIYFSIVAILGLFNFDFGRGVPYPYFFIYLKSPAGLLGFSNQHPFYVGSAYWMLLFSLIYFLLAKGYKTLGNLLYNKHQCPFNEKESKYTN